MIKINREPCYEKHLESFEEGIKNTYGEELLNNAKAHFVEDANEVWKYRQPESTFLAIEDFDLSSQENQPTHSVRMVSLEMPEGEGSEQLDELRSNEIPFQDPEQNNAANLMIEVDDAKHVERIPRRVNEWFALIDQNRERESQGLEPIYPWESHLE